MHAKLFDKLHPLSNEWGEYNGANPCSSSSGWVLYTFWLRKNNKAPEGGDYYDHESSRLLCQRGGGLGQGHTASVSSCLVLSLKLMIFPLCQTVI